MDIQPLVKASKVPATNIVKRFGEIDEHHVQVKVFLHAFFQDLSGCELHISCASTRSKIELALWKSAFKTDSKTVDDHSCKDITSDGKESYPAMVITQTSATLFSVQVNNLCIFEVLWDFSFSPEFFEETC